MESFWLTRAKGLIPQCENPTQSLLASDLSAYATCFPVKLDKIKNLHTKDTIATENCAIRGQSI